MTLETNGHNEALAPVAVEGAQLRDTSEQTAAAMPQAAAAPIHSPDGKFRWDGTGWQPVEPAASTPEGPAASSAPALPVPARTPLPTAPAPAPVQYSPDGRLWWDGQTWQPVASPASMPPVYPQPGQQVSYQGVPTMAAQPVIVVQNQNQIGLRGVPYTTKSKVAAILLALFLGGLGIHKFYLGQAGMGVLYLLFCWTFIPAIVALIEVIIYLTMSDEAFAMKYATGYR